MLFGFGAGYLFGRHAGLRSRLFGLANDTEVLQWRLEAERTVVTRIERRLAQIESRAREQGRITSETVEEMFSVSEKAAGRYLAELTRRGVLARSGIGQQAYYALVGE